MTRVLVTGAGGFVGRVVCRRLLEVGLVPRAALRDESSWNGFHEAVPDVKEFAAIGDLGATPKLDEALANVSAVVHLAARVHVMREKAADPEREFERVNVDGSVALASAAVQHGVRRLVFVSTVKVNGESTSRAPFTESDPPDPQDFYAVSKWKAEEALRTIAAASGLELVIVRPPLVYGPGVRAQFLRLIRLVARGFPLPVPDTNNRRSLVGTDNLADFLVRCASHENAANRTFLVSDGEDVSTHELTQRLARALGRSARFLPIPAPALRIAGRLFGIEGPINRLLDSLAINSERAREVLSWDPPATLDHGLAATANWYRKVWKQLP